MFPNYLNFRTFNSISLLESIISPAFSAVTNPVFGWITFGKIAENPVVTPTSAVQVIRASADNRYLQSVTVKAIPTTPGA
jgi:hypothetical protein